MYLCRFLTTVSFFKTNVTVFVFRIQNIFYLLILNGKKLLFVESANAKNNHYFFI